MRKTYASLIVSIFAGSVLLGCGGGSNPGTGGPPDMATGNPGPPPTFIAGNFKRFPGSTTDGWAIVTDADDTGWAIKLADGTQRKIADHVANVSIYRDVVFVQHDLGADGLGPTSLWRGEGPARRLADSSPPNSFAFSFPVADADGHIAYYRAGSAGSAGNELVVDTVEHTAPHVVLSGVELTPSSGACWPTQQFYAGRLLVSHCDAGATTRTLSSFDPASGTGVDLQAGSNASFSTRTGVGVLMTSTAGEVSLVAADGSAAPRLIADNLKNARFDTTGTAIFAVTRTGSALERIPLAAGAVATTLVPSGVLRVRGVSPDDKFVTFAKSADPDTGLNDLWITDATAAGTPIALVATTTASSFGYNFTDDGRFALYLADSDIDTGIGSLRAFPTAGGAERIVAAGSDGATPMGGGRIAFTTNRTGTWPDLTGDVGFLDLGGGAAPTSIGAHAYAFYDVQTDNKTILWLEPGAGLHVTVAP